MRLRFRPRVRVHACCPPPPPPPPPPRSCARRAEACAARALWSQRPELRQRARARARAARAVRGARPRALLPPTVGALPRRVPWPSRLRALSSHAPPRPRGRRDPLAEADVRRAGGLAGRGGHERAAQSGQARRQHGRGGRGRHWCGGARRRGRDGGYRRVRGWRAAAVRHARPRTALPLAARRRRCCCGG